MLNKIAPSVPVVFQVCQEEEFLELSPCQLVQLIRRDELNVREERDVYNAVVKVASPNLNFIWFDHAFKEIVFFGPIENEIFLNYARG